MATDDPQEKAGAPGGPAAADTAAAAKAPVAKSPSELAAGAQTEPPPAEPSAPAPVDEFDQMGWEVPLVCKECDKSFVVPYRNFHPGVVFHCPGCQGSWVPNTTIARSARRVFEEFWDARKRARQAFDRGEVKINRAEFDRRQDAELAAFRQRLERMAREMKPAGKLVRPKGLASMFT